MSYLVLARKWRPQNFDEVVGQDHVTRTLKNAIREGRLAHALLYSGPRGVGKTTVARIVAKAVNCKADTISRPCNKCDVCTEITSGSSVDVLEIDGASNRGIDEIRQLRENIYFRPTRCESRIYIIDEVHMLTKEAFNALLKTLEEPPAHVIFQFATTEPHKVPATIRSRCQHFEFRRLSTSELANHLDKIVKSEGLGLDGKAVKVLAREAKGSVRDSLSLLDQVAAYGAGNVEEVCDALGTADVSRLETLAFAILNGDMPKALGVVKEVYGQGRDIAKFSEDFLRYFRELCVLRVTGAENGVELTDFTPEEVVPLFEKCKEWPQEMFFQALDMLLRGQETIARSSFPRIAFEMVLIKLAIKRQIVPIDKILDKMSMLKAGDAAQSGTRPSMEPFEPENGHDLGDLLSEPLDSKEDRNLGQEPSATRGEDGKTWEDFVKFVKQRRPSLATILDNCKCKLQPSDNRPGVTIFCASGMNYDLLSDSDNRARLEKLAADFWQQELQVNIDYGNHKAQSGMKPDKGIKSVKEDIVSAPLVQEALRIFEARIADVKPQSKDKQ